MSRVDGDYATEETQLVGSPRDSVQIHDCEKQDLARVLTYLPPSCCALAILVYTSGVYERLNG